MMMISSSNGKTGSIVNTWFSDCELPWKRPHGGIPWIEKQRGTDRLYVQTRGIQTPFAGVVDEDFVYEYDDNDDN